MSQSGFDGTIETDQEKQERWAQLACDTEQLKPMDGTEDQGKTLIDRVDLYMADDDDSRVTQSRRMIHGYHAATPEGKQAIDRMFACLCGHSLGTIITNGDL